MSRIVVGSGAVACGPGAVAAGEGGIAIGGGSAKLDRAFPYESVVCIKSTEVIGLGVLVLNQYVLSTCHVLLGKQRKKAYFPFLSSEEMPLDVVTTDPSNDLAIARLCSPAPKDAIDAMLLPDDFFTICPIRVWGCAPDGRGEWFLGVIYNDRKTVILQNLSPSLASLQQFTLVGGAVWDRIEKGIIGIVSGSTPNTNTCTVVPASTVLRFITSAFRK